MLAAAVLGALSQHAQHGYGVAQSLEHRGWGSVKGGTLYPVLRSLEAQELITGTWDTQERGPARKYYRLTDGGLRTVERHRAAWKQFSLSMDGLLCPEELNHAQDH